jgi:Flp pilus assembly pilin Flp
MKLFANIKAFSANESGAVTVDWVVLTAAIVGLGIAVITAVRTGTTTLGNSIATAVGTATVGGTGVTITPTTGTLPN